MLYNHLIYAKLQYIFRARKCMHILNILVTNLFYNIHDKIG